MFGENILGHLTKVEFRDSVVHAHCLLESDVAIAGIRKWLPWG